MNLLFGDNFISYVIDDKNGMSFNIFGVQDIRKHNSSLKDQVTSIAFHNPNIKVVDYKVDTGISQNGYRLVNMIVTVQVLTNHVEKADILFVQFDHEKTTTHDFGEITVQNCLPFHKEHLAPSGEYKVGYSALKRIATGSLHTKKEHDFITMTPILSYRLGDNEHLYNMPGVLYGILDSDQDKIKKIMQRGEE
ncbi:hypothetical protein KDJ56_04720 [Brevibacillus composti]|uniref:Uncharacterized protein n=1 Tax=Brevibacillus composti TaxID=2796470 RepID=A0A7T5EME9_9BACL|nr:hypothetical protein [Brevibacillus composti]QQE75295.1 hypothetical protein JD108_05040 [Brevibacillus composti]QUO42322.1 hypothetical protein KDJ56_04720 [Brevibacillus composti]